MKPALIFLVLAAMTSLASAEILTKSVDYERNSLKFQGFLATDTDTKRPGVVVIPEWWGLNDYAKGRAKELATMGYVAFVVDIDRTG